MIIVIALLLVCGNIVGDINNIYVGTGRREINRALRKEPRRFKLRDKTTWHYKWFKYNIYKPIRSIAENIRYGYFMSEEAQIKSRREFIERCKNDN